MGKYCEESIVKIVIITEEDLFYVLEFFKEFYKLSRDSNYTIAGVTILPPFNKNSILALAKQMYGFYGPFQFFRVGILYVFKKVFKQTIRSLTKKNGIPLFDAVSVNSSDYISLLKQEGVALIVSVAAPEVFNKTLLNAVPYGCINSHSSLLPENRGMMPVFWGLYKGSHEIGVTIHSMEEKIDTGEILMQERIVVGGESLNEMILKTKKISAVLMHKTIEAIADKTITRTQIPEGGSYQTFPTPADMKEFHHRGKKLF